MAWTWPAWLSSGQDGPGAWRSIGASFDCTAKETMVIIGAVGIRRCGGGRCWWRVARGRVRTGGCVWSGKRWDGE